MSGRTEFFTGALSGSEGSVLDPIVAIRYRITLDSEESATINMVTGIGDTREAALSLVEKYQDRRLADRVFDLAWTHGQVLLRQLNATDADARLYGHLTDRPGVPCGPDEPAQSAGSNGAGPYTDPNPSPRAPPGRPLVAPRSELF